MNWYTGKFEYLPSFYIIRVHHPSILILYETNNYNTTEFQWDKASLPVICVPYLQSLEKQGCLMSHLMSTSGLLPPHLQLATSVLPITPLRFPLQHFPEASYLSHSIFLSQIHSVHSTIKTHRRDREWKLFIQVSNYIQACHYPSAEPWLQEKEWE